MRTTELCNAERVAHFVLHWFRKFDEVPLRRTHPVERLFAFGDQPSHGTLSQ
jgi:hypothetical protein